MANKQLTAKVKLDIKSAEKSLTRLSSKIRDVQKAIERASKNEKQVESAIKRAITSTNRLNNATQKVANTTNKVANTTKKVNTANTQATNSARKLGSAYGTANRSASSLLSTVKRIAATYLGVQTIGTAIKTSDTITSAENRLNNIEGGSPELTAKSLDKMYAAAQRSRSAYNGMLSNVSKTMALAGDSFQNNIDNAIRFQEIMAKAYTIGGASATEASTSMYQLVQALGSGILQGDELRSVREGAPIAYKKIEEFAQGVLNTEESLKDLASQGVITSDIIVAAIMDAEEEINKSFNNTQITFAQAWDNIKNMATKAFEPVLQKLNKILNSNSGQKAIEGIGKALVVLANVLGWVIDGLTVFFNWCAENWEWLKYVILGILIVIGAMFVKTAVLAIWSALQTAWAWIQAYWPLLLIVAGIVAILYIYELWRQGTITTTEAIAYCLFVIAAIFVVVAAIMTAGIYLIVALVIAAIALIIMYFAEFCGYVNVGIQAIVNSAQWLANVFIGVFDWICAAGYNAFAGIANFAIALKNAIVAICTNIGIAFENGWIHAQNAFWSFIQNVLEGIKWLEPAINAVAKAFGKEGFSLSGVIENVSNKQKSTKDYMSVGDAWSSGMNTYQYKDLGDAWNNGFHTYDAFESGWSTDAYNKGYNWGQGIEDAVNEWGSQWQNEASKNGIFSDLGNVLGLNHGGLLNPNDPAYGLGDAYDPSGANNDIAKALEKLGDIDDNTSDIKNSMDLTDDDLEYLRKIAEMEWRNEFTTAEIKVDMTNNNTVNGERDLDGIVSYLADVLREEMTSVAYGVHT